MHVLLSIVLWVDYTSFNSSRHENESLHSGRESPQYQPPLPALVASRQQAINPGSTPVLRSSTPRRWQIISPLHDH